MNATVVVRANEQADPALVLFGRDEAGKPRASWFDALSADLALKAADLMKMRVLPVETEEQRAIARQLQPGRVFENGRARLGASRGRLCHSGSSRWQSRRGSRSA
jgi:hypothetical protein